MFALQVLHIPFQLAQLENQFSAVSFFFPPFMEELTSVWKCKILCITIRALPKVSHLPEWQETGVL
jgi:hypothetical protein